MTGEIVAKQRFGSGAARYWAGVYREAYAPDMLVAWKVINGTRYEWSQGACDTPREFHEMVQREINAYLGGYRRLS